MGEAGERELELLWLTLPESRPGRELSWLAGMPDAERMSLIWPVRYGPTAVPRNVATINANADAVALYAATAR